MFGNQFKAIWLLKIVPTFMCHRANINWKQQIKCSTSLNDLMEQMPNKYIFSSLIIILEL